MAIAEILGVTKQRAHQIAEEKVFPRRSSDELELEFRWTTGR